LSLKTKVDGLRVVWSQNHSDGFLRFDLKTSGSGFPVWASKPAARFSDLGLKINTTVSWFGPQNYAGFGLSVAPQNQQREDGTGHASRFDSLLCLEASRARISQPDLKADGGVTMGGARNIIAEVVSRLS
jgi:hypothetical protein